MFRDTNQDSEEGSEEFRNLGRRGRRRPAKCASDYETMVTGLVILVIIQTM